MSLLIIIGIIIGISWVWKNAETKSPNLNPVLPLATLASTDPQAQEVVLSFADENDYELVNLTLVELASHAAIIGASGSGKTSTICRLLLSRLMELNLPGVIFAAKNDDFYFIQKIAQEAGRELYIIDRSEGSQRLNFIQYLLDLKKETSSIVEVLFNLPALLNKSVGTNTGEQFWNNSGRMLLKSTLDLIYLTGYPVSIDAITSVLTSIPNTAEDLTDPAFIKQSLCVQLLLVAESEGDGLTHDQRHNLRTACHFFKKKYLSIPEVTRGSINAVLDSMLFYLNDGTIRRLFCSDSSFTPEECFIEGGRTVFCNFPTTLGQFEKFASGLFREVMKQAVAARDVTRYSSFMYFYADEYQTLALQSDADFWGICRSQKAINLIAFQTIDSLAESLGSGEAGRQKANIILGNCGIRFFLKSHYETAKWFSDQVGKHYKTLIGTNYGTSSNDSHSTSGQNNRNSSEGKSIGTSTSQQRDYVLFPEEFMHLKSGNAAHKNEVEMYLLPNKAIALDGVAEEDRPHFLKITLNQTG